MSYGRCNYSEYTEDEFQLLKEVGDAEAGDKQGNNPVSIYLLHFIYMSSIFANTGVVRHDKPDPHGIQPEVVPSAHSL